MSKYKVFKKYIPFVLCSNARFSRVFFSFTKIIRFLFLIKSRYKMSLLPSGFLFAPFAASFWQNRHNRKLWSFLLTINLSKMFRKNILSNVFMHKSYLSKCYDLFKSFYLDILLNIILFLKHLSNRFEIDIIWKYFSPKNATSWSCLNFEIWWQLFMTHEEFFQKYSIFEMTIQ